LLRNRKVNTKKRQNRHLPELAFLILGTYFTAPLSLQYTYCAISKIVKEFWKKIKKISKSCYSVIFMGKILRLHLRDSI
ncbi:MAG: hypothetical protein KHY54_11805, partial [Roseburia sp.]|nr:hypothetical protein [Roseburia sp.]